MYILYYSQPTLLHEPVFYCRIRCADPVLIVYVSTPFPFLPSLYIDTTFVSTTLSALDTEYQYWMREGEHAVKLVSAMIDR
jgi:hypothetical protein